MNQKLLLHSTAILTLAASALCGKAQTAGAVAQVSLTGTRGATGPIVSPGAIVFDAGSVGGAPRQLTATFALPGRTNWVPGVGLHYGHDYTLGAVACASSGTGETCSVPVTFQPTLPGGRPDALFLSDGFTRLATVPLFGIGNAPLALLDAVQPVGGAVAVPEMAVVDEEGTLFVLDPLAETVTSIASDGAHAVLPIAGLHAPRGLAIDGAGVLYLLDASPAKALTTFDTVQGLQGSLALPVPAESLGAIASGTAGMLYAVSAKADALYSIHPDQSVSTTAMAPSSNGSVEGASMVAAANGEVILGGAALRVVGTVSAQAQPRIAGGMANAGVAGEPIGVDAAGAIYATTASGLSQIVGVDSSQPAATLHAASAMGAQGNLYLAVASGSSLVDRSETTLNFGGVPVGSSAAPRMATLYNGGNQLLSIADIRVAGAGFSLASSSSTACGAGATIAPGNTCQISVSFVPSHSTPSLGTVTLSTNSLNGTAVAQVVQLRANVTTTGSQAVLSPTSLSFPTTTVNVASTPLTITLSNPGTVALNFTSLGLGGVGSGSYSLTHTCFTTLPASLAPGASCVITVTFKPLSAVAQAATLTIGDDAGGASATQTAALTGTGTPAPAPKITFTPTSLAFGSSNIATPANWVVAGTTGPPAMVTITNTGNATANISSIALTTTLAILPYTQTNTCGATLAAAATCVVTVTFSPTAAGTDTASLVVTDDAIGSPQSEAITGIATAGDYTISGDQTSLTVASTGGTATMNLTATPDPAPFPTPINFSVFGLPAGATYSLSPMPIFATQSANSTALTITVAAYHPGNVSRFEHGSGLRRTYLPVAALALGVLCVGFRRRRLPRLTLLLCLVGLGLGSLSGCGGIPIASGVTPGSYVLTITASSANGGPTNTGNALPAAGPILPAATHTAVVNLTVQ